MAAPLVLGIDVGGTNTDAVVLHRSATAACPAVLASAKAQTTDDVVSGVQVAGRSCLGRLSTADRDLIACIVLGTTAFLNALLQGKGLLSVGVLRLCGPSTSDHPPLVSFPPSLRETVSPGWHGCRPCVWLVAGGFEHDGCTQIASVDPSEVAAAADAAVAAGVAEVVVSSVFGPVNDAHEREAEEIILGRLRDNGGGAIRVTRATDSGGRQLDLLCRENCAVLNACLRGVARRTVSQCRAAFVGLELGQVPLYFSQNDGTVVDAARAAEYPIRSIASGPVNSVRGAWVLSSGAGKCHDLDCIVVDVGGTSTDCGVLEAAPVADGGRPHPRWSNAQARVAGVPTNHMLADVRSIALGGGTVIQAGGKVGPASVGNRIMQEACCFGNGRTVTMSDVALLAGGKKPFAEGVVVPAPTRVALSDADLARAWETAQAMLLELVESMRRSAALVRVIVVGGGAHIADVDRLARNLGLTRELVVAGPDEVPFGEVANAAGAPVADTSGLVEEVVSFGPGGDEDRGPALARMRAAAVEAAVASGGVRATAAVVEVTEVPLAYLLGNTCRVRVRALAELDATAARGRPAERLFAQTASEEAAADAGSTQLAECDWPCPTLSRLDYIPPRQCRLGAGSMADPWRLSVYDVHCLAIGAGVLGCGGGGSTEKALLHLTNLPAVTAGRIRVISTAAAAALGLPVVPVAIMGAPTIDLERSLSADALQLVVAEQMIAEGRVLGGGDPLLLLPSELGGSNGLTPFLLAASAAAAGTGDEILIVDGDLMGRAFPELQMQTTAIYGLPQTPACLADHRGRVVVVKDAGRRVGTDEPTHLDDLRFLESAMRPICSLMGASAAITLPSLSGPAGSLQSPFVIEGGLSRARQLGDAIIACQRGEGLSVEDIVSGIDGAQMICDRGKVTDMERHTTEGFARGTMSIQPAGEGVALLRVDFQNEFLRVVDAGAQNTIACVPTLICLVDAETCRPIATEDVRFGLRVCLFTLPPSPEIATERALGVVGPKAFGFLEDTIAEDEH